MSCLIENSLFSDSAQSQNLYEKQKHANLQKQNDVFKSQRKISDNPKKVKAVSFPAKFSSFIQQSHRLIHKFQNFTLIVIKKFLANRKYGFEGYVFENQQKLFIKFKNKRILFGKEWIKNKVKHNVKLSLSINTGQLKLFWPQIFLRNQQIQSSYIKVFQKLFNNIFMQFIHFFETEVIPIIKKVIYCQNSINQEADQNLQKENIQSKEQLNRFKRLEKYLYMSTTIDSFSKDKQSYQQTKDKFVKQKLNIIKVQSNIDLSFSNLNKQLQLFSINSIRQQRTKLATFGNFDLHQTKILERFSIDPSNRTHFQSQQQFILNGIGVKKIQNNKKFVSSGGSCNICIIKIIFQYIFSDDPKFWIQANKKASNDTMQKSFVIKQAKSGSQEKIRHENQIIKQMKGGFSIYLPRYYKIQSIQTQYIRFRSQDIVLMDYLIGQTLDNYSSLNKETLSFWTKVFLIKNLLSGLKFLAAYKIVHLDFKPMNIVVISQLLTKIIDFGQSYHPKLCKQNYFPGISLPYSCPQIFYKKQVDYDQKCDIFSLGVIMFQLFFEQQIFSIPKNKVQEIYKNQSYMQKIFLCPQSLQESNIYPIFNIIFTLTMKCLHPNPQYRPTLNWMAIVINIILMNFRGK